MKAIAFNSTGDPEKVLQVIEKEKPVPGADEVLVKVLASTINPADIFFIRGTYRFQPSFPGEIAGFEGAGIVESTGKNAGIDKGALVSFFFRKAWAEYAVVPAAELTVFPKDLPIEKAAQFSLNPFTAWGLLEEAQPAPGEWMLLTGANSAVSRILIQLARQKGVRIIALVRDLTQAPELHALGAEHVFNIEDLQLSDHIRQLTDGKGFNVAMDPIGGAIGTKIFENIAPFGRFILYGSIKKEPAQYFNAQIVYKNLSVKGFGIRAFLTQQTKAQRDIMTRDLIEAIGKPDFQLPVAQTCTLDQYKEALKANSLSSRPGKILLVP